MKMQNRFLVPIIIAVFVFSGAAVAEDVGGYAGAYLQLSVNPRATGMGNAYTAVSDDISSVFFNPGAVAQVQRISVGGAYRNMSYDRSLQQLAVLFPVRGEAALAISAEAASMGNIIGRDSRGDPTGTLSNMDAVFSVVFARRFSSYFSIGGDIRYYYKKLVTTKANSAGFDAGAMVHLAQDSGLAPSIPINLLRFGLVVRNISAKYPWQTGDYWGPNGQLGTDVTEKVPIIVKAGVSALTLKSKLLLAVDVQEHQKEGVSIFTGGEYWLVDAFALRTGLAQGKPTFGVGFKVPFQKFEGRIDIAVEQAQNVGGWESIFGFTMGF